MQSFEIRRNFKKLCEIPRSTNIHNDDRALSFPLDVLRDAGVSLGDIRSTLAPPKTTFENLRTRAESLLAQAIEREHEDA